MKRVEVFIGGVTYKSIGEAARAHGVIPSTAYSRIARGWGVIAAVTTFIQCRTGTLHAAMHADRVRAYNRKHKVQIAA